MSDDRCLPTEHLPWKLETAICCTETKCTKTFRDNETYLRERNVYERNLSYVPKLLESDDERRTLTMENVGTPLGTKMDTIRQLLPSFLEKQLPDARTRYRNDVRQLHEQFQADTGLFHNDVQYKNVLKDKNEKLYLIDFEHTKPVLDKERKSCFVPGHECWNLDDIF